MRYLLNALDGLLKSTLLNPEFLEYRNVLTSILVGKKQGLVGWMHPSIDVQAITRFSEELETAVFDMQVYKTRTVALDTIQSPPIITNPKTSLMHLKMLQMLGPWKYNYPAL